MSPRRKLVISMLTGVGILGAAFFHTFASSPLPRSSIALPSTLPDAHPPEGMALFQLPTGVTHRSAAFAYRGGSFSDKRDFSMTAALVRHPRGDFLIDTGFGSHIEEHLALLPWWFRAITSFSSGETAARQLARAHYDTSRLRGILITHAHWDHTSGAADFADTPVWLPRTEHVFVRDGGWITAVARKIDERRFREYEFNDGPYLDFARSFDVHDDGSIVIVQAPGHTPGSVVIFVTLPSAERFAFIGDLAWQREGVTQREERPWLLRTLGDNDIDVTRQTLTHVSGIAERFPSMHVIPAHDARAFEALPRFGE